jgi:hypothetical protein
MWGNKYVIAAMVEKTLYLNGKPVCTYEAPADKKDEIELCRRLLMERGLWKPALAESTIFNQAVASRTPRRLSTTAIWYRGRPRMAIALVHSSSTLHSQPSCT